jgi:hypothetical protein
MQAKIIDIEPIVRRGQHQACPRAVGRSPVQPDLRAILPDHQDAPAMQMIPVKPAFVIKRRAIAV